ncbi:MAG: flavodoxin domain-containing protein [Paracoccaceae bacterium]
MSLVIAFGTVEGQTDKIARFIENIVKDTDEDVQVIDTAHQTSTVNFEGVDTVILVASVHERRHPTRFEAFVTSEQKALALRRTLMISVSMSAAFPEGHEDAQSYLDEFKLRTDLDPDAEMLVAGAIRSREYDYYATQVLKHVVLRGRSFDPAVQEHEFTDWEGLGDGVSAFLEGKSI